MDLDGCPQISNNIQPRSLDMTVLLMTPLSVLRMCPHEDWMPVPPDSWECPRRTSTKLFEKGTNHWRSPTVCGLFSVPCPGWCVAHVFRLTGSHLHPDLRRSLPRVCQAHAMDVPCVALSSSAHSHTLLRWLVPNSMHVLHYLTLVVLTSTWLNPFHVGGNYHFLPWEWLTWICSGTLRMGCSHQWQTSAWRTAIAPSLLGGSVT